MGTFLISLVLQFKSIIDIFENSAFCLYNSALYCWNLLLKGTATLMITTFYMEDLNKQWILIPVSSKSVEKCVSCGHLNMCKWTVLEVAIL